MHANNETGAIQDIKALGTIARKYGAFFHTDATQTIGKLSKLDFSTCDLISISAHKFHGMKGSGFLYINDNTKDHIDPLFYGGKQEMGLRPGTENIIGIITMSMALSIARHNRASKNKLQIEKKDWITKQLKEGFKKHKFEIIGANSKNTVPNTLFISIDDICNINLCRHLSEKCIIIGIGAACNNAKPSHVLRSMNLDKSKYMQVLRISLSDYTSWNDCQYLVTTLIDLIEADNLQE